MASSANSKEQYFINPLSVVGEKIFVQVSSNVMQNLVWEPLNLWVIHLIPRKCYNSDMQVPILFP